MVAIVKRAGPMARWSRSFFSDMSCGRFHSSPVLGHHQLRLTMKETWPYPISDKVTIPVGRLSAKDTCDESPCWLISKLPCCSQQHIKFFKVYVCAHIYLHRCRGQQATSSIVPARWADLNVYLLIWLLFDFFRFKILSLLSTSYLLFPSSYFGV